MPKDWDRIKDLLFKQYVEEQRPLDEVIQNIYEGTDFHACERSYRARLKAWGWTRYNTQAPTAVPEKEARTSKAIRVNLRNSANRRKSRSQTSLPSSASPPGPTSNVLRLPDVQRNVQETVGLSGESLNSAKTNPLPGPKFQPLHYAVLANDLECVRGLLQINADVNARGLWGFTPLHLAFTFAGVLDILVHSQSTGSFPVPNGALLTDYVNNTEATLLLFDVLLSAGANMNQANDVGVTPFHLLLLRPITYDGCLVCVMLKRALQLSSSSHGPLNECSALFEIFLRSSMKVDWISPPGYSFLAEIFGLFLDNGAAPDIRLWNGETLLDYLLQHYLQLLNNAYGRPLKHLLRKSSKKFLQDSCKNLLHDLTRSRCLTSELMEVVLSCGFPANQLDAKSRTPLTILSYMETTQVNASELLQRLKTLLKHGAHYLVPGMPVYSFLGQDEAWTDAAVRLILEKDAESYGDPNRLPAPEFEGYDPSLRFCSFDGIVWWRKWRTALESQLWGFFSSELLFFESQLPFPIARRLNLLAVGVLAQMYLRKKSEDYISQHVAIEKHCVEVAEIIQYCRNLDIDVGKNWVDYYTEISSISRSCQPPDGSLTSDQ